MGRIDAIIDDKIIRDFRLAVVTRKGGKKGDFSKALEEAMDIWTKIEVIEKLKSLIQKSTGSGPDYKNLVDSLKSYGDIALPTMLEIADRELMPQRNSYITKAIKDLSEKS